MSIRGARFVVLFIACLFVYISVCFTFWTGKKSGFGNTKDFVWKLVRTCGVQGERIGQTPIEKLIVVHIVIVSLFLLYFQIKLELKFVCL